MGAMETAVAKWLSACACARVKLTCLCPSLFVTASCTTLTRICGVAMFPPTH